MTTIGTPRTTS